MEEWREITQIILHRLGQSVPKGGLSGGAHLTITVLSLKLPSAVHPFRGCVSCPTGSCYLNVRPYRKY